MTKVTLDYQAMIKDIDLDNLQDYQVNNIVTYVNHQVIKVLYRIYHSHPVPLLAMVRLHARLSKLYDTLDMITNFRACLN